MKLYHYRRSLSLLVFGITMTSLPLTQASTIYCVHDQGSNNSQFCFGTPLPFPPAGILPLGPIHQQCDIEALDIQPVTDDLFAASGDNTPRKGHLYRVNKNNGAIIDVGKIVDEATQADITEVDALSFQPLTGALWGWGQDTGLFVIDSALPQSGEPIQAQCLSTPTVPAIAAKVVIRRQGTEAMEVEDITWNQNGTVLYATENKHTDSLDSHGDPENRWTLPDFNFDFDDGIRLWAYDTTDSGVIREICSNLTTEIANQLGQPAEIEALESLPNDLFNPIIVPDNQDLLLAGFHGPKQLLYAVIATPPLPLLPPPAALPPCELLWKGVIPTQFNDIEGLAYTRQSKLPPLDGIMEHLRTLQQIAEVHEGNRVSGSQGYEESANYIVEQLTTAGYQVTVQPFEFPMFYEVNPPQLEQTTPNPTIYPADDVAGFFTMSYSGSANVTAVVEAVDVIIPPGANPNTSTSGCETEDFAQFTPGHIALIQRGTCPFSTKVSNAQNAGASGVIIFNEGQPGRIEAFHGTLQQPNFTIPVVGTHFNIGEELYTLSLSGDVTVHMIVDAISETRMTSNIIGETPTGNNKRTVVVGAHLDSVPTGPGINDNGSGSATILAVALQLAQLDIKPANKVRFAFWSAEEFGLIGSTYYVDHLSPAERKKIMLYLNFDMVASPNYVRFVYDGDDPNAPEGSVNIKNLFLNYFASQGVGDCVWPTELDGRSDYLPFMKAGIPVGGLFTGADGSKTNEQVACSGGTAGIPYDENYHTPNDNLNNINEAILNEMANATAQAVLTFAMTNLSLPDIADSTAGIAQVSTTTSAEEYLGPFVKQ
ncbi:aminopeptidase Y [Thioploca ingrica]|uniref:Aminopeptidase Y n=1 Tax=Thioploca ingrica TaxID=40754 RepID=A0A090ANK0_9GAMM|nr:aminopeptidase Y [Thioploca ingrica]